MLTLLFYFRARLWLLFLRRLSAVYVFVAAATLSHRAHRYGRECTQTETLSTFMFVMYSLFQSQQAWVTLVVVTPRCALHVQKLKANTQKRIDDLQNPKNASNKKLDKGIDISLSVEDIMQRMEQLKEKVVVEQDTAERERIITRIQALNSAWMELTGEKDAASGSDAKASGKDLATTLKDDLAKYSTQLKEIQAQEETQRDEVEDMREKMNASQPVIDRLRQEREVCLTVVRSLWDKIKAINEEYSGMFDAYKEELKEWNARMDVIMADRCAAPHS